MHYADFAGLQVPVYEGEGELAGALQKGAYRLTDLIEHRKKTEWVVDGLIPKGALLLMAGDPKLARKSLMSMQLALCVARGEPFLGLSTRGPATAIYCNLEDGVARTAYRAYQFGVRSDGPERRAWAITDPDQLPMLIALIRHQKPCLVFIDPLVNLCLLHGVESENESLPITKVLRAYQKLAQVSGTTIVIVHHYRKDGMEMRGSSALKAACDGWLEIDPCTDDQRLITATLRDGDEGFFQIGVELNTNEKGNLEFMGVPPEDVEVVSSSELRRRTRTKGAKTDGASGGSKLTRGERRNLISTFLMKHEGEFFSRNWIQKECRGRRLIVGELLEELLDDGLVEHDPDGKNFGWVPLVRNTDDGADSL